jgi:hypothetical protein
VLVEILIRFLAGGLIVTAFATLGEIFKPKTFAGMFGAAPSIAIVSLGLVYVKRGGADTVVEARWMAIACAAMLAYCATAVVLTRAREVPVWAAAAGSWAAWFAVAIALWWTLHGVIA